MWKGLKKTMSYLAYFVIKRGLNPPGAWPSAAGSQVGGRQRARRGCRSELERTQEAFKEKKNYI